MHYMAYCFLLHLYQLWLWVCPNMDEAHLYKLYGDLSLSWDPVLRSWKPILSLTYCLQVIIELWNKNTAHFIQWKLFVWLGKIGVGFFLIFPDPKNETVRQHFDIWQNPCCIWWYVYTAIMEHAESTQTLDSWLSVDRKYVRMKCKMSLLTSS